MPAKDNTATEHEVVLGRVSGLFGVKGWVKVHSYTEPRDAILEFPEWNLQGREGSHSQRRPVTVAEGRKHGKSVVVRFAGVEDRDVAVELLDSDIVVGRRQLPEPADGEYYWTDLEGMQVVHRDGRLLGRVAYLLATGANDVLVLRGEKEILVPFIAGTVILDVDKANGVISVDWEWD
jgi:16S rRNA processing protein RimM